MAEEQAAAEEGGKSKKKLIIFIIIGVLLGAAAAGGAAFFLLGGKEEVVVEVESIKKEAIYSKIRTLEGKPSFVATLQSADGKRHYLQAFVEAKSRDQDVADALTLHMPLIVARLNNLFATQDFDELMSIEGKEKLQQASTELVQGILQEKIGKPGVEKILFTNFVMQ
ncbi:flagellar basal body-associated FliL family protein [Neptunomonas phycophila]|jgi:flagellar FliL protein|uniref:Flagellar protein FliL n=1 Tax=Neptunomonas phycophila TaxID=1572645 RepID=A0AAW7XPI3_9GAMM|nr:MULTISPECIES: flagellar basal body-associated FliL family protein [Neptunomonas]MBT3144360.1 flagellar basal body-associated FliL family protein [Neptunomonas phycophila]MDN2660506.1 flagellar basal body-associated FliL family protein [Neptunomonas sp. CHC150]MDO6455238.1 flagellar basal body-associated FliL family protein [Neptunomonas phycophila]MDO6469769.1 flagellar basal body-associated FliL family protein [Neptunomonas phycophila]MDO6785647.1 flagellar basal body-associated FliL famil